MRRAIMTKLFLNPKQTAERLSVTTRTLANKRAAGSGPPYFKMDGVIRYPINKLETYINKHIHHNARAANGKD
jgi:hypothetical protein|tara:strand:- start:15 stop:233 length:219 start_codon:yes stop_codon:yes gene_type:complete